MKKKILHSVFVFSFITLFFQTLTGVYADVSIAVFEGAKPVIFTDESGTPAGLCPELLNYIFTKSGEKVHFVTGLSFYEAYEKVLSGEIDIMPAIVKTPERSKLFDFNSESFIVTWSQVFISPGSSIESVLDLRGKDIALMKNDQNGKNFITLMSDFDIPFNAVYYDRFPEMSDAVLKEEVDAMVSFNFYIKSEERLKPTGIIFSPSKSLVGVKKGGSPGLLEIIDSSLKEMKQDDNSFYNRQLRKWLFVDTQDVIPGWIYITLFISLLVIITGFLFVFMLKIQVKRIHQKLFKSEEVYKRVFNTANDSIFLYPFNNEKIGTYTDVNEIACRRLGYTRDELLSMTPMDINAQETRGIILEMLKKIRDEGNVLFKAVHITKEGKRIPVEINAQLFETNGKTFALSIIRDLSYREEFDSLLSALEMKYRTIADYNYDWEFWLTAERSFVYSSPSCKRISGYEADDFLKDSHLLDKIVYKDDRNIWDNHCISYQDETKTECAIEIRIVRKDGTFCWVEHQCRKIFGPEKRVVGFRGSFRDITKRKDMEEQLGRKDRLESMGVLAGGIAHDFNNILAIIRGYAELGEHDKDCREETRDKFTTILQAANRGANLTGQILDFARDRHSETKPVKVSEIAKEVYNLIKPSFPSSVKIKLNLNSDASVLADEGQIHQVFMNICANARLAMPDGGKLSISIREADATKVCSLYPDLCSFKMMEVSFKDTGIGMSDDVKNRIFDPFFTTRGTGKGAGMGMSVVHGLVKQWNGRIAVESSPGKGTEIFLYLQIYEHKDESAETSEISETSETSVRVKSRIMIIDDEEIILDLVQKFLEREGHLVSRFSDPSMGLKYFKNDPSLFDLIITDMTMPDISGADLAEIVKSIRPEIPVLLSTGYSEELRDDRIPGSVDEVLKKPFTGADLNAAVNRLLNK